MRLSTSDRDLRKSVISGPVDRPVVHLSYAAVGEVLQSSRTPSVDAGSESSMEDLLEGWALGLGRLPDVDHELASRLSGEHSFDGKTADH